MNAKHTPAPWRLFRHKRSIEISWPETNKKIASVPLNEFTDNSGNQANAALIAAAPEMLEALKALLALHIAHHNDPAHAAARRAIAKAEGRSDA